MIHSLSHTQQQRENLLTLSRDRLQILQLDRLNALWQHAIRINPFYCQKYQPMPAAIESFDQFASLPTTTKSELIGDSADLFSKNLTFEPSAYTRFHRTSGTRGQPMVVLDTPEDWQWWVDTWQFVLDAANVDHHDRAVMAFSFGPFIGFWSAYDAAIARGMLVAPSGGLSTEARLEMIQSLQATCLFCTPSYALRMVEIAKQLKIDLKQTSVRKIIVAGEPGGSIVSIREQIETAWDATVVDHSGASEIGPWGFDAADGRGLFVNESEFIAEFETLDTGEPASEGELSELILTTLGRPGCPVIRYRTGDLVRPRWQHQLRCRFALLDGGVLGRVDDMMIVRGVNIYPSSIEAILRSFPDVAEYQLTAFKSGAMDELKITVECPQVLIETISAECYKRLGLRVDVQWSSAGSLPRFDAKGKRFIDRRNSHEPV
jgi:phenylacetate-CoA ligase